MTTPVPTAPVVKVRGIAIDFNGTVRVLPPLNLAALEQLGERLDAFKGDIRDKSQIATLIDATHAALRRNYPDVTREEVAEDLGLENMQEVFAALMDVSGTRRKASEAANPGEATTA